jgi:inward rectifier potassium channel
MTEANKPAKECDRPVVKTGVKIGNVQLSRYGYRKWYWADTYHWILRLTWPRFLLLVTSLYLSVNFVFACLYFLAPGSVANAKPGSFLDLYFFSIETLATVGYGNMNPATTLGHIIASVEILLGMMGIAVITGLMFARFARPTARIEFSKVAVITQFNGVPTLMMRAANERNNLILEASVRLSLVRTEMTKEGMRFNRFYDLKLERERTGVFALSWTIMHKIDQHSPLHGLCPQDLIAQDIGISVAMSGQDDTLSDTVHARHSYGAADILFGKRFVDIISEGASSKEVIMDFTKFHDTMDDGLPKPTSCFVEVTPDKSVAELEVAD